MTEMDRKVIVSFVGNGKDDILEGITDIESANVKLKKEQSELNKIVKKGVIIDESKVKRLVEIKNEIAQNNKNIREQTKLYQGSISANKQIDDSIKGVAERLRLARAQYDNLSKSERENHIVGKTLLKNIQDLDVEYKDLTSTTGRFQTSVGDYSNAIQDAIGGKVDLKRSLREMKDELVRMTLAGEQGSKQFVDLRQKTAQMEDAIGKVNTESKRFANDFKKVQDVVDTTNFMVQGFTLVQSSMALMGVENEKLEKSIQQLVAVGNISNSVNAMSGIIMKNNHVLTKVQAGLNLVWNKTIWLVNGGLSAMQVLLSALGIGLFVAGLALLVKYWEDIWTWTKKNIDILLILMGPLGWVIKGIKDWVGANKELVEETENYIDTLNKLSVAQDKNIKSLENEIDRMKVKGKSIEEIKIKERELLEAQIQAQKIRMELAFMESASLENTAEQRQEASDKFFEEMEKMDDLYHQLEIFDLAEKKRQEDRTEKLRQETIERNKVRSQEVKDEQEKLDEIKRRNDLADAELNLLLNDSLENRLALADLQHKQMKETTELTNREKELAEQRHQQNISNIMDEWAEIIRENKQERKDVEKTEDEIERENQRQIFLTELENRRLSEMSAFEQRQELLDEWLMTGVLNEQEYTAEVERNNKKRIKNDTETQRQRHMLNMQMTTDLLGSLSNLAQGNDRMFKFQQRASQLQALINTYVGITQVLRDSTLPTYAKIAAVAATLATGLGAVTTIQNQTPPSTPTFRDGGQVLLNGPTHEGGGIPIYAGNQYVGEAEGGELVNIVSKRNVNSGLIDNATNMYRANISSTGGYFRDGGMFEPRQDFNNSLTDEIKELVKEIAYIPVVVNVDDINDGQEEKREVLVKGNLK